MTTDVELLPLLKHSGKATDMFGQKTKLYSGVQMQDYARDVRLSEENNMEQEYYGKIETPREAIYEAACALDNQDVPLEDWPVKLIAALARAGFAVVPVELPHDALGRAAIAGVAETGNPKHAWDFLIAATRAA